MADLVITVVLKPQVVPGGTCELPKSNRPNHRRVSGPGPGLGRVVPSQGWLRNPEAGSLSLPWLLTQIFQWTISISPPWGLLVASVARICLAEIS